MAIITPQTTVNLAKAIDPAVRKNFTDIYSQVEPQLEKVFQVSTQTDYNEQHQQYTGFGQLQYIPQGTTYPVDAYLQAFGTTYTPQKFGSYIQITDELMRYDKTRMTAAQNNSKEQAKAAARSIDKRGAAVFLNGFNPLFTSYGDGKPLFSTQHQRADGGGNISNASLTGIVFSDANLETGMLAGENVVDDRGELVNYYMDTLLIGNTLRKAAGIVIKSPDKSDTTDRAINAYSLKEYPGIAIDKVMIWKFLSTTGNASNGSNTAWFLLSSDAHMINWLWSVKTEVGKYDEANGYLNDTYNWKVRYEASTGWDNYRGSYGSLGNQLAYSN